MSRTKAQLTNDRLFKISLTTAGLRMEDFARRHKTSQQMISYIVYGQRTSKRLERVVFNFMKAQLQELRCDLGVLLNNWEAAHAAAQNPQAVENLGKLL